MVLLGDEAQLKGHFGPFGDSGNIDARWCTVCAERTIGSEIVWTHPMEVLGDVGYVETCFGPFGDSVSIGAR